MDSTFAVHFHLFSCNEFPVNSIVVVVYVCLCMYSVSCESIIFFVALCLSFLKSIVCENFWRVSTATVPNVNIYMLSDMNVIGKKIVFFYKHNIESKQVDKLLKENKTMFPTMSGGCVQKSSLFHSFWKNAISNSKLIWWNGNKKINSVQWLKKNKNEFSEINTILKSLEFLIQSKRRMQKKFRNFNHWTK